MHQFVGGLPGYLFINKSDVLTVLWFLTRPFNILFSSKIKEIVGRESNEHRKRCCFFSCWSWYRVNKISTDYPFKTPRIIKDQRSRLIVSRNQYEEKSILPKPPPLYLKGYFRENRPTNLLLLQYCQEYQNRGIFPWSMENPASVLAAQVPHPSIDLILYIICCWFNGYRMLPRIWKCWTIPFE